MKLMEREWKENVERSANCPRCGSSNTKFCYYNNYSLTQPRYFCKSCRRYWTKGGSLRNVPVGGGCRKNRRSSPKNSLASSNSKFTHNSFVFPTNNPDASQNIDLAIVYANFLNHKPDSNETPQFKSKPSDDFHSLQHFIASNPSDLHNLFVPEDFCYFSFQECGFGVSDDQKNCFGLESSFEEKIKNQVDASEDAELELPPFPGEDMVGWSSSSDPNLVCGNWSPIDLSSYDTFSRA